MPAERVAMRQAREIIRLKFSADVATREIARRLGLAPSTIRETLKRIESAGLVWPLPNEMSDGALETALYANRRSKRVIASQRAGLAGGPSGVEAQARHPADRLGRIYCRQSGRLQLLPLCCGPAYVISRRGFPLPAGRLGRALTQHK